MDGLDIKVLSVNAWGQRVEPAAGSLIGLGEHGVWVPARPDTAYPQTGLYLGRGLVLVARLTEDRP